MATFITSGPIGFSGNYAGSVYSFITDAGGTVATDQGISLSGLFASASEAGITLSGSASYLSPHSISEFYGMYTEECPGAVCCLALEDAFCFILESDGTDLDLECCPVCIGEELDSDDCILDEDGCPVDVEASCPASIECCIALVDGTCILLADGITELDMEDCSACCIDWEDGDCLAMEEGGDIDLEECATDCCIEWEDEVCIEYEEGDDMELEECWACCIDWEDEVCIEWEDGTDIYLEICA